MKTPDNIIAELEAILAEQAGGANALYDAEVKLAKAEDELNRLEALTFIEANGSIELRKSIAKIKSADLALARDIARAEVNRIKSKIKQLESAAVIVSVMAKQIELTYRH